MSRFIALLVSLIGTASVCTDPPADAAGDRKPNVLFIISDQQHAGMLSCAGNRCVRTPGSSHPFGGPLHPPAASANW